MAPHVLYLLVLVRLGPAEGTSAGGLKGILIGGGAVPLGGGGGGAIAPEGGGLRLPTGP
jgi:hypothetical protein